jgi:hypothetical protein
MGLILNSHKKRGNAGSDRSFLVYDTANIKMSLSLPHCFYLCSRLFSSNDVEEVEYLLDLDAFERPLSSDLLSMRTLAQGIHSKALIICDYNLSVLFRRELAESVSFV